MAQKNFRAMAQTLIFWGFEPWLKPIFDMQILTSKFIYIYKVAVFLFIYVSESFSNTITYFCVTITQVLLQTFTTRGKQQPIQSPTFVSQLPKS